MAVNLKGLAQNKRVQLAAAGGAVLGLVALVRAKGGSGASDTADSTTTAPQSFSGGGAAGGGLVGGYDSTASDVYNNLETALSNRLDTFGGTITDLQDQLKKLQQKPTTPKPPGTVVTKPKTPVKPPIKKPVVKPKAPSKPKATSKTTTITIRSGDTLSGLARRYGTTVGNLQKLNKIKDPNRISAGARLRVK